MDKKIPDWNMTTVGGISQYRACILAQRATIRLRVLSHNQAIALCIYVAAVVFSAVRVLDISIDRFVLSPLVARIAGLT